MHCVILSAAKNLDTCSDAGPLEQVSRFFAALRMTHDFSVRFGIAIKLGTTHKSTDNLLDLLQKFRRVSPLGMVRRIDHFLEHGH